MKDERWKHGGDIYTNGVFKGKDLVDFSSNINPLGVSDLLKDSIEELFNEVVRYPDYQYRELKASISEYLLRYENVNVSSEEMILGNGASEILDLSLSKIRKLGIVVPSFVEYEDFALKYNAEIEYINLTGDFQYDYSEILSSLNKLDGIILGNPNNPTGNIIDKEKFKDILDFAEKENKKIIVDEAFVEFSREGSSLVDKIASYKCLVIIRAFTKFFGMPGARLGYGITSDKQFIEELKKYQLPWNINSFAEIALEKSYKDENYISKSREWIANEIGYMKNEFAKLSIFKKVYDTNCNFILCKLDTMKTSELYEILLNKGILIRNCSNFKKLDDTYVRFAIKSRNLNKLLIDNLKNL
ncbi:pyridoxal phosphate-dependent aminotransferase [Clostridium paridis]|uniref:Aminotransferase class I/II-fold pyridoxal phosphate-dependent enzyme n=1 Tax=Clostridium paridis TaxID=2803863 RepID=A0A937K388_9CLOT|nr:histidinol-phosphate transaminase [Clostridium paridis]MBL4930238.1 aminotransferase class I/II-fold pyridoxal phosphate-dependent enzyme [Clostridium paridis]